MVMSAEEIADTPIRTRIYDVQDETDIHTEKSIADNVKVEEKTTKEIEIHPDNEQLYHRSYVFPLLAQDMKKCKKEYGLEGIEKLFKRFKKMSDPSIRYKRVVTAIVRIRTLANSKQSLGEYVFYLCNLYGYQKHFDPETSQINHFESARMLDMPFGLDKKVNMMPNYEGGSFKGYKYQSEYNFYTEEFIPAVTIENIKSTNDMMENVNVHYSFKDMGKDYGGYTQEELSTLRADKLVSRNTKKEMGSEIKDDDKHQSLRVVSSSTSTQAEDKITRKGK